MFCLTFYRRLQFFRILDHCHNLFKSGRAWYRFDKNFNLTFFENCSGENRLSYTSSYRKWLTCNRCLIDHSFTSNYFPIKRDHISHTDHNMVSRLNIWWFYKNLLFIWHTARKISDRLFMRPFFYDLTNSKQEHDRSSCSIISTEYGNADCCSIQDRNLYLTMHQATDSVPDIFHWFYRCNHCTDRHWKE